MTRRLALALIALLSSLPLANAAFADAQPAASLEVLLTASAGDPSEHRALASHFRVQAETERARAARLRSAARHLGGGKLFQVNATRSLRLSQAEMLDAAAREHELLARRHEEMAS